MKAYFWLAYGLIVVATLATGAGWLWLWFLNLSGVGRLVPTILGLTLTTTFAVVAKMMRDSESGRRYWRG